MASRSTLLAGIVGIATIISLGLYAVLAPRVSDDSEVGTGGADPASAPTVVMVDAHEAARARHGLPWPFEAFAREIALVRRPDADAARAEYKAKLQESGESWEKTRFSITVVNQRLQDIIPVLASHFTHTPTKVYTPPPHFEDEMRFSLDMLDVTLKDVVQSLHAQSLERLQYDILPHGIVIGTQNAVIEARMKSHEWRARIKERKPGADDPLLNVSYRPDFDGAHIGAVIRDIRDKTDIEVIVGRIVWGRPVKLEWRSDPMPLRDALNALAKRLRSNWYLHEGRIFILAR